MRKILIGLSILGAFAICAARQMPLEATVQTRESLGNVILSNAVKNRIIMFGGVHGSFREDEDSYKQWRDREKIAYANLEQMIFHKDPVAKVVIFCGAWHINERPYGDASADLRMGHPERIKYLAFYMDETFKGKTFTVSLLGPLYSKIITPYCDLVLDLEENTYYYNLSEFPSQEF